MAYLTKEDYIHISYNSITRDLCDDILNIFHENIIHNNLYIESKNCCYEIIDNDYKKIKVFLKNELINNLKKYTDHINRFNYSILNHTLLFDDLKFYIKKDVYLNSNNLELQDRFNWNMNGWKILKFI